MTVTMTTSVTAEAWDQLVRESPGANIFHERRYIECFSNSSKNAPFSVFFHNGDALLAGIVGLQTRMLGDHFTNLLSRAVVYGGILLSPEMNERRIGRDFGDMIAAYDDHVHHHTLFTEVRNLSDATHLVLPLAEHNYRFEPHLNYLIDLSHGRDCVWSNLSKVVRKKVRRAEEQVDVHEVTTGAGLEAFYSLVEETYSRVHVPFFEREVFQRVFDALHPLGWIRVTLAMRDGRAIASRAALTYRGRVFDWFAGSNDEGNAADASTLLVWDMMGWGCDHDYQLFDFGGAGDPHKAYSVRDFKSRFHGRPVNFGRFTRVYSRSRYLVSATGYNVMRRVLF